MKLSVSAWCLQRKLFSNQMTIFDFIEMCNNNGVKYVELLDCFLKDEVEINKINSLLKKYGMEVAAYSVGNDFVSKSEEERLKQIEDVKKGIDTACRFNTKLLRVFSGNKKDGISFDEAEKWIVDSFKEVAKYAEEKGVTMVLENHGLFAGKASQVKGLIDKVGSKYLKANADVGNFFMVNENPLESVKTLKDYIGFVHFKDFKEVSENEEGYVSDNGTKYQGIVLGKGEVPMGKVVDLLFQNEYDGFLSIEYEGIGDPVSETIECIEFTKSIIK